MRARVLRALSGFALVGLIAGCAGAASVSPSAASTASAGGSPSAGPSSSAGASPSGPVSPMPASPVASSSALPSAGLSSPAIAIDPALLDVLPAQVDGLDRQHDAEIDAGAFADPTVAGIATGGATGLYIDPAGGQFAYAAVIRLATGGLTDAQFRAWRDTFDAGACAQAGGVSGHAQAKLGAHDTYIGTCAGGLDTYHTILADRGLLISVSATSDRRLGEKLVAALPS